MPSQGIGMIFLSIALEFIMKQRVYSEKIMNQFVL